jgi:hypothetical protein
MSSSFSAAAGYKKYALVAALVGGAVSVLGLGIDRQQFFVSYLVGFMWVSAIPFGALGLLMIHTLTGGNWGWTIRPFLVSAAKTVPVMALLFIPLVLGMHALYPWTNTDFMQHDPVLVTKISYLNDPFWIARTVFYLVTWTILAWWLLRRLVPTPAQLKDTSILHPAQRIAAGGFLFYVLSFSFAALDWVMSIEPHWFSSVFGAIILATQAMSAFAFSTWCLIALDRKSPNMWLTQKNVHDLGKFLFMTVMLWGYLSFSQYLIIWAGNLPEETFWYHERSLGAWKYVSAALVVFQFVVPFCWLLSKHIKRNIRALPWVISLLFIVRWLEQLYLIKPGLMVGRFPLHWLDVALPAAIGGVWLFVYFTFLSKAETVPVPDGYFHHHGPEYNKGPQDKPVTKPA